MPAGPLISYAQNAEDVVLWRALRQVTSGHYVEIGANDPRSDSISKLFYDHGWKGITVEPLGHLVAAHRDQRPRDIQVQVAITDGSTETVTLHAVSGSGLSTTIDSVGEAHREAGYQVDDIVVPARTVDQVLDEAGWADTTIHFMVIDIEGAEEQAIRGLDLNRHRPWVLVVEATSPNSSEPTHQRWEPMVLQAGYTFCLFDGLSRFYVANEHRATLEAALSVPACVLDNFLPARFDDALRRTTDELNLTKARLLAETAELERQLIHWRHTALVEWAEGHAVPEPAAAHIADDGLVDHLRGEIEAIQRTLSWRVTRPLRGVRRLMGRVR